MFNIASIVGTILRPIQDWYQKRYPSVVVALHHQGTTAVARVATFGQPIFVRTVRFELLLKDVKDTVAINQLIAPYGQLDCPLTPPILRALTLTKDLAVSVAYRTASGHEAVSEAHVFNIFGGHGAIAGVADAGNYLSVGKCPKCSEETLFSNRGVMTKRQLEAVKRLFKRTCKDLPEP